MIFSFFNSGRFAHNPLWSEVVLPLLVIALSLLSLLKLRLVFI